MSIRNKCMALCLLSIFPCLINNKSTKLNDMEKVKSRIAYSSDVGNNLYELINDASKMKFRVSDVIGDFRYEIYEYNGSERLTGDDVYLGFAIEQNPNVDIEMSISRVVLNGGSVTTSCGVTVDVKLGAKVLGTGVSECYSAEGTFGSSWATTTSMKLSYNLNISRNAPSGTYYFYRQGYTANYLVVTYYRDRIVDSHTIVNAEGIVPKVGFLQKTPVLLKPLSVKC